MSLSTPTRQLRTGQNFFKETFFTKGFLQKQEKKSSQSDVRLLIGNFVGDQFRIGGRPDHNLYSEDQNKKQQEQVSLSKELNFFRKKGEQQKNDKVFTVWCQGEHKPRKR